MTRAFLTASLALWRRRLKSRRAKRTAAAHALAVTPAVLPSEKVLAKARLEKYERLVDDALAVIARRKKQLGAPIDGVGEKGVRLIKSFEGFTDNGRPYLDTIAQPPVWTIGYGHIEGVTGRSARLSEPQAAALLQKDLDRKYAPYIAKLGLPLNQDQFDALVSFVYNVGPGGVASSTQVGKALREHRWRNAADHLLDWDKAGGHAVAGLTRRRKAERTLFLTGKVDLT
jgi:lysozyme